MDELDRRLLELVNLGLPLVAQPFAQIGDQLGLSEAETLKRLECLKQSGYIRRIGATVVPASLGWYSTLCACEIDEAHLEDYAATVNAVDEVTHNYLREGSPNCWFTVIAPEKALADKIIAELEDKLGVSIGRYPARRVFKISARFKLPD
jgi:DNA-binding Lrp family transcriptional regulator